MSHVVAQTTVRITDLDVLEKVAHGLGLVLRRGQEGALLDYRWFGENVGDFNRPEAAVRQGIIPDGKASHVLTVDEPTQTAYEAGLLAVNDEDGGYHLVFDNWGNKGKMLTNCIGVQGEKLLAEYNCAVVEKTALEKGYNFNRVEQDGRIVMTVTEYAY
jgi:hypothetical protein